MKLLALALQVPQSSNIYVSIYQNENSGQKSRNNEQHITIDSD